MIVKVRRRKEKSKPIEMWIDTDRIVFIQKEEDETLSLFLSNETRWIDGVEADLNELLDAWRTGDRSAKETDEKYIEILNLYKETLEKMSKDEEHCQCECEKKKRAESQKFPTAKREGDTRPVMERIKNMNDVLEELGPDHPLVTQYRHMLETTDPEQRDDYTATFLQLRMVCEALNEGWHATYTPGEWRYWPWFCIYKDMEEAKKYKWSEEEIVEIPEAVRCVLFGGAAYYGADAGFASAISYFAPSGAGASVGSRLCFKSSELAMHAARHFLDLWLKFYFM